MEEIGQIGYEDLSEVMYRFFEAIHANISKSIVSREGEMKKHVYVSEFFILVCSYLCVHMHMCTRTHAHTRAGEL